MIGKNQKFRISLLIGFLILGLVIGLVGQASPVVAQTNTPPVALDQTATVAKNSSVEITLAATDTEGELLTYTIVTNPAHGTLTGDPPTLTYTPNPDYMGLDSFTFIANDGTSDSNIATVDIFVYQPDTNPIYACTNDVNGANDQPNQKDLTRMCTDVNPVNSNTFNLKWNWDDIYGSGAGATYDSCALFDNDGNGFIDKAVCVQLFPDTNNQNLLVFNSAKLYTCNNDKVYCNGSVLVDPQPTFTCNGGAYGEDPFQAGENYPQDFVATCSIPNSVVDGMIPATLQNVCSIPSGQPGSNNSDCIAPMSEMTVLSFITVQKLAIPNESVDFAFTSVGTFDGGTTNITKNTTLVGTQAIRYVAYPGTYSVTETPVAGWDLVSKSCKAGTASYGTPSGNAITGIILPSTGTTDLLCIFTNVKQGSIIIEKQTDPNSAPGSFTFNLDGASQGSIPDGGQISIPNLSTGAYSVQEVNLPAGFELTSISCTESTSLTPSTHNVSTRTATYELDPGETITCTFTNTANIDLKVTKSDGDYARPNPYLSAGETFTYTIDVEYLPVAGTQTGATANAVVMTDTLDPNLELPTDGFAPMFTLGGGLEVNPTCVYIAATTEAPHKITCTSGTLTSGQKYTVSFPMKVKDTAPMAGLIETGTCWAGTSGGWIGDPFPDNGSTTDQGPVDVCNQVSVSTTSYERTDWKANNSDSEPTDVGIPTAVELISFEATGQSGSILLTWEVGSETETLGYNLYRAASLKGPRTLLTETPIFVGEAYEYLDVVKSRNTFYYWLESVDLSGGTTVYDLVPSARALK
jgi:hypothetical protein